jgi:hypothetical protein
MHRSIAQAVTAIPVSKATQAIPTSQYGTADQWKRPVSKAATGKIATIAGSMIASSTLSQPFGLEPVDHRINASEDERRDSESREQDGEEYPAEPPTDRARRQEQQGEQWVGCEVLPAFQSSRTAV